MTDPLPPTPGPGGRRPGAGRPPTNLREVIGHAADGQGGERPVTRLDRVREVYRICGFDKDAAARCGVNPDTFRGWVRDGTRLRADVAAGRATLGRAKTVAGERVRGLSQPERDLVELVETMEQAEAEGRLLMMGLLDQACRGGATARTVTTKTAPASPNAPPGTPPAVVETTTRVETLLPDMASVRWRLERRYPDEWGRTRVEVTGKDGAPIEVVSPVDRLLEDLDRIRRNAEEAPATNGHAPAAQP